MFPLTRTSPPSARSHMIEFIALAVAALAAGLYALAPALVAIVHRMAD